MSNRIFNNGDDNYDEEYEEDQPIIIFTNGCFDLLHYGHVRFLQEAKKLNPDAILIVGLNTDSSVKQLKGQHRPIISETHRKEMLLALECVDEVMFFSEPTACELIERIQPDVYVKSAEYANVMIPEFQLMEAQGGAIAIIHFEEELSEVKTTNIINRIVLKELSRLQEAMKR